MNTRRKDSQRGGSPEEGKTGVSWVGSRTLAWRGGGRREMMLGGGQGLSHRLSRW